MGKSLSYEAEKVKKMAKDLGADLCGVAPAERFKDAPTGFKPQDVYPDCRSVIVVAKRMPWATLDAKTNVPYTQFNRLANQEVDRLTNKLALFLEDEGMTAIPVPSDDPYDHWEPERMHGQGIISMRHAGHLAGLGILGRNTLLKNALYGNMIQIGAVLVNAEIPPDPMTTEGACPENCRRCIDSCPAHALDGTTVVQKLCRPNSGAVNKRGHSVIACYKCRQVCPHRHGVRGKS